MRSRAPSFTVPLAWGDPPGGEAPGPSANRRSPTADICEHAPVCEHPLFGHRPAWLQGGQGFLVGRVTHDAIFPDTAAALWTVLSDPETWADWLTVHQRWEAEPRSRFVPGVRMTAETLMLGVSGTVEWTVESVIAPGSVVLMGTGAAGLRARLALVITSWERGSRLVVTSQFVGELLTAPVIAAIERDGAEQLELSLENLRRRVSAPAVVRHRALRLAHSAPNTATDTSTAAGRLRALP